MICFTTRDRPKVLEYSLAKTREVYDGFIQVVDDASELHKLNKLIAKKYDCAYILNNQRWGIPRSKERGFRCLLSYPWQYWFDDDCFPKEGWLEKIQWAQEERPHLLHLREWAHIHRADYNDSRAIRYTGATACFMAFTKALYEKMKGFQAGHGVYGGWHHELSLKLGGYYAIENSQDYIHSFDIDGVPADFDYHFCSSLPREERVKK